MAANLSSLMDFEKLVERAVMVLPEHIREKMENVAIVVEKRPSKESNYKKDEPRIRQLEEKWRKARI